MLTVCTDRGPDQVFRPEDGVRAFGAAYRFGEIDTEERKGQENVPGLPKKDSEESAGCVAKVLERGTYFIRRRTTVLFD
jgi:hypothetical protein